MPIPVINLQGIPVETAQVTVAAINAVVAHQPLNRAGMGALILFGDALQEALNQAAKETQQPPLKAPVEPPKVEPMSKRPEPLPRLAPPPSTPIKPRKNSR